MIKFTHKGWFGICPIYLANTESGTPHIEARHWTLEPLFILSELTFGAIIAMRTAIDPEWEPSFPIKITSKIIEGHNGK